MTEASSNQFIDNERTCVTEWRFAPGEETGWHTHGHDYVVVPMLDGNLKIEDISGETNIVSLKAGAPYFRKAGVNHNVINDNDFEYVFVEVEIK